MAAVSTAYQVGIMDIDIEVTQMLQEQQRVLLGRLLSQDGAGMFRNNTSSPSSCSDYYECDSSFEFAAPLHPPFSPPASWLVCLSCMAIAAGLIIVSLAIDRLLGHDYVIFKKQMAPAPFMSSTSILMDGSGEPEYCNTHDDHDDEGAWRQRSYSDVGWGHDAGRRRRNSARRNTVFSEWARRGTVLVDPSALKLQEPYSELGRHWTLEAVHHSGLHGAKAQEGTQLRYTRRSQRFAHGHRRKASFVEDLGSAAVSFLGAGPMPDTC
jgi:hypothetical protein